MQCSCKRGVMSNWDFKCGHCRTKADWAGHALMLLNAKVAPGKVTVVNKFTNLNSKDPLHYIGRGSPLGNPFVIGKDGLDRNGVIAAYNQWLSDKIVKKDPAVIDALNLIANLSYEGHSVQLSCFCAPRACHGDIIKRLVDKTVRQELLNPST